MRTASQISENVVLEECAKSGIHRGTVDFATTLDHSWPPQVGFRKLHFLRKLKIKSIHGAATKKTVFFFDFHGIGLRHAVIWSLRKSLKNNCRWYVDAIFDVFFIKHFFSHRHFSSHIRYLWSIPINLSTATPKIKVMLGKWRQCMKT